MAHLGLSFSYGGAYVGYYYGVYEYLYETFDLSTVKYFAGISAGSQVAFWMASGIRPSTAWNQWFIPTFESGCIHKLTVEPTTGYYPDLRRVAIGNLRSLYTPHMLDRCNIALFVGATVMTTMEKATLCAFSDDVELFGALLASQCIPFLFDTHVTIRGVHYIDGAISHRAPYEPCDAHWIHISVFEWETLHVFNSFAHPRRFIST